MLFSCGERRTVNTSPWWAGQEATTSGRRRSMMRTEPSLQPHTSSPPLWFMMQLFTTPPSSLTGLLSGPSSHTVFLSRVSKRRRVAVLVATRRSRSPLGSHSTAVTELFTTTPQCVLGR
ncbi:hypothetical protein E2C01_006002 [Portunus trituberculatus]|uniref:Uncharacterized protein n=1 Tax=Portunus trituberculatus TaxID=210409 RepID=A0A5B7CVX9_PORTR|nr:hypothetical protein [Portunus trituberculatus]